ncbi:MAG TPA: class I SAM-dependent methyltransferase [Pseudonocardiaceae bacterium]
MLRQFLGTELPIGLRGWDGSTAGPQNGPIVVLRSRRALRRLLWDPNELGLARAYVSGDLEVRGDLTDGLRAFWAMLREQSHRPKLSLAQWRTALLTAAKLGAVGPRPKPPADEARLTGKPHTRLRDRAAIAHHYDLGNDFYRTVLDPQMAYSCAYWTSDDPDYTLTDAQRDKLDLICRVEVRLQDYREITGEPFDAASSIEMGEHVGGEHYPTYAAMLHRMLKPTGRLLLQQMSRGRGAPGGGAFIESYIAPDMTMHPLGRTLDKRAEVLTAIAGAGQVRAWRLYMAGGALAFAENRMGVDQILAVRTTVDGRSEMPPTRGFLSAVAR